MSSTFPPALSLVVALALGGCALGSGPFGDEGPVTESRLRQVANATLSGKGAVNVALIDGVAYVSGDVVNAIDERAIVQRLGRFEGVERVESFLRREM